MSISFFAGYDLISRSALFDAEFYRRENPDVDRLGYDPVAHYLEIGADLGRDPGPDFDTAGYLAQCAALGETTANALIHYLQVGAQLGLTPRPTAAAAPGTDVITLDSLVVSTLVDGGVGLRGAGWLVASQPVVELSVKLDGELLAYATQGLNRPDVGARFPGRAGSDDCGFAFDIDRCPDRSRGPVELVLTARLASGESLTGRFGFVMAEHGPRPPDSPREDVESLGAPPARIQVDHAAVDDRGLITIEGWAIALAGVDAVEVWLENERLGAAEIGGRRDDVAEAHPRYVNSGFSGFRFVTDGRPLGEGKRDFSVRCIAKGGVTRELTVPLLLRPAPAPDPVARPGDARVHCDEIRLGVDGSLLVAGWSVCDLGVEAVLIFLDGVEVGPARIGLERPDVGNAFPEIPGARNAGFVFSGSAAAEGITGEHVVSIRVRSSEGRAGGLRLPVAAVETAPAAATLGAGRVAEHLTMWIDAPNVVNGAATAPVRNTLSVAGWAIAGRGVEGVDIAIDGKRVAGAYYGLKREDVAGIYPDVPGALLSGFAALLPNRALPKGEHQVSVIARDAAGEQSRVEFTIQVEELEDEESGPWSLRRRLPQSEIEMGERLLAASNWSPSFSLLLRSGSSDEEIAGARLTLRSLRDQGYEDWRVVIAPLAGATDVRRLKRRLLRGLEDVRGRVFWPRADASDRRLDRVLKRGLEPGALCLMGVLSAGDELGADALLEFATWTALNPDADLVYCDERRINPVTGKLDAFFKPDWSPDLALAMNYIGRLWLARPAVLRRAGATLGELETRGEWDLVLRCAEQARLIGHAPVVLCQRGDRAGEDPALERAALEETLRRRGVGGLVLDGRAPGLYEVERTHAEKGLVSIVIPTCAAKGYIKTCIETLRERTSYRNFEIVCIENIPAEALDWRVWLRANADRVVTTEEPFNWSRFNNLAAAEARGEYLVFLNDDIETISPNWLNVLLSHAARPEVGVVGPLLLYPDRTIQHAGMFLARMGTARHAFRFAPEDDPGYFGLTLSERNVSCVTGACLMVRREAYDRVGGFDETHSVVNNDVDFCLRIGDLGLRTVFTPRTKLIHHELASRSEIADDYDTAAFDERWGDLFLRGDPYFNRNLSKDEDHYGADREPVRVVYPGRPLIARDKVRRLLVVKVDHIGDCVTALPAMRRLREHFPGARISVLAAPNTQAIWSLVPGIDEIIPFSFFHARSGEGEVLLTKEALAELQARLAPYRFDLAIDLRKTTDTRYLLKYSGARFLAGFDHTTAFKWLDIAVEWEGDPRLQTKRSHVTEDFLRLVDAVALACDGDRSVIAPGGAPSPLPPDLAARLEGKRVVAIHPAAGTPTREWPAASFAQLIDLLVDEFDVEAAIIGGPGDQLVVDVILAAVRRKDRVTSLLGRLSLDKLAEFLPNCALFVGNNSGPSHLAAALGTPTVAVHSGVIASEEWSPFGKSGVAIRKDMFCAPCYISTAGECQRGLACVTQLGAGEVLQICRRILALSASNRGSNMGRETPALPPKDT